MPAYFCCKTIFIANELSLSKHKIVKNIAWITIILAEKDYQVISADKDKQSCDTCSKCKLSFEEGKCVTHTSPVINFKWCRTFVNIILNGAFWCIMYYYHRCSWDKCNLNSSIELYHWIFILKKTYHLYDLVILLSIFIRTWSGVVLLCHRQVVMLSIIYFSYLR